MTTGKIRFIGMKHRWDSQAGRWKRGVRYVFIRETKNR